MKKNKRDFKFNTIYVYVGGLSQWEVIKDPQGNVASLAIKDKILVTKLEKEYIVAVNLKTLKFIHIPKSRISMFVQLKGIKESKWLKEKEEEKAV